MAQETREMWGTDIGVLCAQRRWKRSRLVLELRRAAEARGIVLPGDESLLRTVRMWTGGKRGVSELYAELLAVVFGVPFAAGKRGIGSGGVAAACGDRPAGAGCAPGCGHPATPGPWLAVPHPVAACGHASGQMPAPPEREVALLVDPGEFDRRSGTALLGEHRWPTAAWGQRGTRRAAPVSMWPERRPYRHLLDLVDAAGLRPLSRRAVEGFHGRMERSSLRFDERFRRAVKEHLVVAPQGRDGVGS